MLKVSTFVVFGRFIAQRLQAIWRRVYPDRIALRSTSQAVAQEARLDSGADGRGYGDRPELHFGYGTGEEERLLAHDGDSSAGLRDNARATREWTGSQELTKSTLPSIGELARRCSESSRLCFEEMGQDLDRRAGAALAGIEAARRARLSPRERSTSLVADAGELPDVLASPVQSREPVSFHDPFSASKSSDFKPCLGVRQSSRCDR
jgi:hypothetical protein